MQEIRLSVEDEKLLNNVVNPRDIPKQIIPNEIFTYCLDDNASVVSQKLINVSDNKTIGQKSYLYPLFVDRYLDRLINSQAFLVYHKENSDRRYVIPAHVIDRYTDYSIPAFYVDGFNAYIISSTELSYDYAEKMLTMALYNNN